MATTQLRIPLRRDPDTYEVYLRGQQAPQHVYDVTKYPTIQSVVDDLRWVVVADESIRVEDSFRIHRAGRVVALGHRMPDVHTNAEYAPAEMLVAEVLPPRPCDPSGDGGMIEMAFLDLFFRIQDHKRRHGKSIES